jgi:hypothetical protein
MNQYRITLVNGFKFNTSAENEKDAKAKVQKVLDTLVGKATIDHVTLESPTGGQKVQ